MRYTIELLLLLTVTLSARSDLAYTQYVDDFDTAALRREYILAGEESDDFAKGRVAFGMSGIAEKRAGWTDSTVYYLERVFQVDTLSEEQRVECAYMLSKSYFSLIQNPSTWMKYSKKHEHYLKIILKQNPSDVRFQVLAAESMIRFPSSLGSEEDGKEKLLNLIEIYPEEISVLEAVSDFYLDSGEVEKAEAGFRQLLSLNGNHRPAKEALEQIELLRSNRTIRQFRVDSSVVTSHERLLKKVNSFTGDRYSLAASEKITGELEEIAPVEKAELRVVPISDTAVDIEIFLDEDDTRGVVAIFDASVSNDYSGDALFGPMPTLFYMDENVRGSGLSLEYITVVVYNQLDLTYRGVFDDSFLDFNINIESMFLPEENDYHLGGVKQVVTKKSSYHNTLIGLGTELPFGMEIYCRYWGQVEFFREVEGMVTPTSRFTHGVSADLTFATAEEPFSPLKVPEGFRLYIQPYMLYKPNYTAWGDPDSLFEHDDRPAYGLNAHLGYYRSFGRLSHFSGDVQLLTMKNSYESLRFRIGRKNLMDDYSLSGYIPEEVPFNSGVLTNLKYTWKVIPDRFLIWGKYDFLFDLEKSKLYNASAVGTGISLPWDLELRSECGLAFDAQRQSGWGFNISLQLSKMILF